MTRHVVRRAIDRWQHNLGWMTGQTDGQKRRVRNSPLSIQCEGHAAVWHLKVTLTRERKTTCVVSQDTIAFMSLTTHHKGNTEQLILWTSSQDLKQNTSIAFCNTVCFINVTVSSFIRLVAVRKCRWRFVKEFNKWLSLSVPTFLSPCYKFRFHQLAVYNISQTLLFMPDGFTLLRLFHP
jgi:hypothetical protein